MNTSEKSLFERIGGEVTVALLIDRFYDRVLKDTELEPYFRHVPMEKLREMQLEFFSMALDGPAHYSGRPLEAVHRGRGITHQQLDRFLAHLLATIQFANPSEQETRAMYERIARHSAEVVEDRGQASA